MGDRRSVEGRGTRELVVRLIVASVTFVGEGFIVARLHPRREADGNRRVLVVVDSRSEVDFAFVQPSVLAALDHFGMPYQVVDLASGSVQGLTGDGQALVLLAQDHLGSTLAESGSAALINAVAAGTGLVVLDHDLPSYGLDFLRVLGIEPKVSNFEGVGMGVTSSLIVGDASHYITSAQDAGREVALRKPIEICPVTTNDARASVLIRTGEGLPAVVATHCGRGRVVLSTFEPIIWDDQVLGHVAGLDDVFWKSITWAARKPFIMTAMPPYVAIRIDDAKGDWQGEPFGYLDVIHEFGLIPNVGVFVDDVTHEGWARMKLLSLSREADFSPHALTYSDLIYFRRGSGEYTSGEFEERARHVDSLFASHGVQRSTTLNNHWLEVGRTSLPYLKATGQEFIMTSFLPGEPFEGAHREWHPAPYGNITYVMDYLGADSNLFAVMALDLPWYARIRMPDGRYRLSIATLTDWDFLVGNTVFDGESEANNVEAAAKALSRHLRKGLDSLFFGSTITHEYMVACLSADEWRRIWSLALEDLRGYDPIFVDYDQVAKYARSQYDTDIAHVAYSNGYLKLDVTGRSDVDLLLHVFDDAGEGVLRRFVAVPAFHGTTSVQFTV